MEKVGNSDPNVMTILHFNDVYNLGEKDKEPVGGGARFLTAMKSFNHLDPMVLFSGDVFSPSQLSNFFHGKQMVKLLNELNITCSVLGNHDFDFGLEALLEAKALTNTPWLLSNVIDKRTGEFLGEAQETFICKHKGRQVGFFGVAERDWIECLAHIDEEDVEYIDFCECSERLVKKLRDEGCEIVIALTHMRFPNDKILADKVGGIDLILGGHDHTSGHAILNNQMVMKSGADFKELTKLEFHFVDAATLEGMETNENVVVNKERGYYLDFEKVEVTSKWEPDPEMAKYIYEISHEIEAKLDTVCGATAVELDGVFGHIRSRETNLSNFIADIVRDETKADVCIINSGTLRLDQVIPAGEIKLRHINDLLPIRDAIVVLRMKGKDVIEALENGVSAYPKLEGRWPIVSGVMCSFDPRKEPGKRLDMKDVWINEKKVDPEKDYTVATKGFLADGKDGYDVFAGKEMVIDEEEDLDMCSMVVSYFHFLEEQMHAEKFRCKNKLYRRLKTIKNKEFQTEQGKYYKVAPEVDGRILNLEWEEKKEKMD